MKTTTIDNGENVIDSRDVIARIEELEELLEDGQEYEDEREELKTLKAFAEEAEGCGDWKDGETLIRESYFTQYCEELLKDCGELPKDIPWYIVIDWEKTADHIRIDYTSLDLDGITYLIRS